MLVTPGVKLSEEKFCKTFKSKSDYCFYLLIFFKIFETELWVGKRGSFTEETDGETAGVLILLAATVCYPAD